MILADRLLHVFHWPANYPIRLLLPAMLALSLGLHLAGLYLVRSEGVAGAVSLPPLPARITVVPGGADSVLLAARDPSWMDPGRFRDRLLPLPQVPPPRRTLEPPLPPLLAAPVAPREETWLSLLPPLAARAWFEPRVAPIPPAAAPLTVRFDVEGPDVTADVLARLRTAAPAEPPGLPTELLVELDATGAARHVWLLRGSGVTALDAAAQRAVQLSRFGPGPGGYRGVLRIVWAPAGDGL